MKKTAVILISAAALFTLTGCDAIGGFFFPNKVKGVWTGYDRETRTTSAKLTLGENTFTAEFMQNSEKTKISGSYSHSAQGSYLFTKNEYGSIIFRFTDPTTKKARQFFCQYIVTASTLILDGWVDENGDFRKLLLAR